MSRRLTKKWSAPKRKKIGRSILLALRARRSYPKLKPKPTASVAHEAAYRQRVAHAQAAAARFAAIIQADRENSAVFRFRLKLDVIEQVLGKANKTILAVPAQLKQGLYLDLRDTNNLPPP